MKKRTLTIAAGLALMVGNPVQAITWGEPDGEDHPNVVTVTISTQNGGYSLCSGTLLTPYVVLTAGHCSAAGGDVTDAAWVRNTSDIEQAIVDELIGIYNGNIAAWLDGTFASGQAVTHPDYDAWAWLSDRFDIGLVLLDDPIWVDEYGQMPTLDQFDFLVTGRGDMGDRQAVIVGYGRQGTLPPFEQYDIIRYKGVSSVTTLEHGAITGDLYIQFTNNPGPGTGPGGTCSGDSGGPAFWIDPDSGEETNIVMAVNSFSLQPQCVGTDLQFRTDIQESQDFVNSYLDWMP